MFLKALLLDRLQVPCSRRPISTTAQRGSGKRCSGVATGYDFARRKRTFASRLSHTVCLQARAGNVWTRLVQLADLESGRVAPGKALFWKQLCDVVESESRDLDLRSLSRDHDAEAHLTDEWTITVLGNSTQAPSNNGKEAERLDGTAAGWALHALFHLLSTSFHWDVCRLRLLAPSALEMNVLLWRRESSMSWDDALQQIRNQWRIQRCAHPQISMVVQREGPDRRYKRLAIFDLDSTLIQNESIDELARIAGVEDAVARITEQAMRGELDFAAAFRQRVALLTGLEAGAAMRAVRARLQLTPGALRLVRVLRTLGTRVVIASGGFQLLAESIREQLAADKVVANELEIDPITGAVTGRVNGPVVDGAVKLSTLEAEWRRLQIGCASPTGRLAHTMAVGDGANDLPMIRRASLGIAFQAKPLVQDAADACINTARIDTVLYLLGLSEREICELAGAQDTQSACS